MVGPVFPPLIEFNTISIRDVTKKAACHIRSNFRIIFYWTTSIHSSILASQNSVKFEFHFFLNVCDREMLKNVIVGTEILHKYEFGSSSSSILFTWKWTNCKCNLKIFSQYLDYFKTRRLKKIALKIRESFFVTTKMMKGYSYSSVIVLLLQQREIQNIISF